VSTYRDESAATSLKVLRPNDELGPSLKIRPILEYAVVKATRHDINGK